MTKRIKLQCSYEKFYKQAEEPVDAPEGSIWVDLDDNISIDFLNETIEED